MRPSPTPTLPSPPSCRSASTSRSASLNKQSLRQVRQASTRPTARKVPAWLITGGADASAEAMLGLAAYVKTGPGDGLRRPALTRLRPKASQGCRPARQRRWPFGAILPWNESRTLWHAWGGRWRRPAVATAARVLHQPRLLEAAVKDSAGFTPQLLAAGRPKNAWSPTPGEAQIAYGVDSRVQSLSWRREGRKGPRPAGPRRPHGRLVLRRQPQRRARLQPATGTRDRRD